MLSAKKKQKKMENEERQRGKIMIHVLLIGEKA